MPYRHMDSPQRAPEAGLGLLAEHRRQALIRGGTIALAITSLFVAVLVAMDWQRAVQHEATLARAEASLRSCFSVEHNDEAQHILARWSGEGLYAWRNRARACQPEIEQLSSKLRLTEEPGLVQAVTDLERTLGDAPDPRQVAPLLRALLLRLGRVTHAAASSLSPPTLSLPDVLAPEALTSPQVDWSPRDVAWRTWTRRTADGARESVLTAEKAQWVCSAHNRELPRCARPAAPVPNPSEMEPELHADVLGRMVVPLCHDQSQPCALRFVPLRHLPRAVDMMRKAGLEPPRGIMLSDGRIAATWYEPEFSTHYLWFEGSASPLPILWTPYESKRVRLLPAGTGLLVQVGARDGDVFVAYAADGTRGVPFALKQ
jgi:hypothetical protein